MKCDDSYDRIRLRARQLEQAKKGVMYIYIYMNDTSQCLMNLIIDIHVRRDYGECFRHISKIYISPTIHYGQQPQRHRTKRITKVHKHEQKKKTTKEYKNVQEQTEVKCVQFCTVFDHNFYTAYQRILEMNRGKLFEKENEDPGDEHSEEKMSRVRERRR